jgi:hypothetical protein
MNRRTAGSWRGRALGVLGAVALATTGGLVTATPAQALNNVVIGAGSFVLGFEYEHSNFNGAQMMLLGSVAGCTFTTGDVDFQSLTPGFNDAISSFRTFGTSPSTCLVKHFQNTNFGAPATNFQSTSASMPAGFNDTTSSLQWS